MHNPTLSDEHELLLKLRSGDIRAFNTIYDMYADTLVDKLHRLIKIESIVEELHQDTFLRLWNIREKIDPDTNLRAYLFTIARNLTIDFYRKAAKNKKLEEQLALHVQLSYDHIEPLLNSKETGHILERLVSLLPPQRQKVFRMIKFQGMSYEEAAIYFGVSISTIKDHMAKSTDFLKKQLIENHPYITLSVIAYYILH